MIVIKRMPHHFYRASDQALTSIIEINGCCRNITIAFSAAGAGGLRKGDSIASAISIECCHRRFRARAVEGIRREIFQEANTAAIFKSHDERAKSKARLFDATGRHFTCHVAMLAASRLSPMRSADTLRPHHAIKWRLCRYQK